MLPWWFHHGGTLSLNIKNDQTHGLARELAELTGESLTEAVTVAVRERLHRLRTREGVDEARLTAVRAIATDMAARLGPHDPDVDPTAFLYDDGTGLPT